MRFTVRDVAVENMFLAEAVFVVETEQVNIVMYCIMLYCYVMHWVHESRFWVLQIAGTLAPTVSTASMSVTVIPVWMVLHVMTRSHTTHVTVHMAIQESSVTRMWIGAALSHVWTRHCASRQTTCTHVYVDLAGQARCVMWRWCLAVMQQYAKVRKCAAVCYWCCCVHPEQCLRFAFCRCD